MFLQKTLSGSFTVRNRHLQQLLASKGMDREDIWSRITLNKGSVQNLDFLTEQEKAVYRTAFELDQRWVVEHAADRTPYICQSQSVNLFLPANVHKRDLHQIHIHGVEARAEVAVLLPQPVDPAGRRGEREGGAAARRGARALACAGGEGQHL